MRKQKWVLSFLFIFSLLFSLSLTAGAAKGWVTEGENTYYYTADDVRYTGGPKTIKGKKYLFTAEGALIRSQVTLKGKKLYASGSDGVLLTKWGKPAGSEATFYGTKNGSLKTGLQKYKKNYYYFDPKDGQMAKNAWKQVKKQYYYFAKNGKAVKSKIYTIDGEKYYFNSKCQRAKNVVKVGKYYYGFGLNSGKMLYGWIKFGKQKYYFNPKNGRASTGWKTIEGKKYFFNKRGVQQTGWYINGKKKYYLDPKDGGARTYGKKKINGATYNFGTKGYVTFTAANMKVCVNRQKNVVTVYQNGSPIKAMTCSTGRYNGTPTGTYIIQDKLYWWYLNGPSIGQYCSHFLPAYLFHSVPMYNSNKNPYNVSAYDYNQLGSQASEGCIRLCVADAKWLFQNVPIGSTVVISDTEKTPLGKPAVLKMTPGTKGADPTDDFSNPGGYEVKIK